MLPTRAAWIFAAGLAWLVLRGILVSAVPLLRTENVVQQGGLLLIVPLISVIASLTVPLFFLTFLRHHRFSGQRALQVTTILAAGASLLSFTLVIMSFIAIARGTDAADSSLVLSAPWLFQAIPLLLVGSLFLFLAVFARQSGCSAGLCRAAAVGALGTLIPVIMISIWLIHSHFSDVFFSWYPAVSHSLGAKVLGLAAAAALLWFLETFAVTYDDGVEVTDRG